MRRGKWLTPGGEFGYESSADGKYLVGSGGENLWYLRAEESGSGSEKVMFLDTSFDALSPDLSPDADFWPTNQTTRPGVRSVSELAGRVADREQD